MSVPVIAWWISLCGFAALNIAAWVWTTRILARRRPDMHPDAYRARRMQLWLSAIYVFGCAYRSVFLVYDVPRICLFDSSLCGVLIGRSVATLAELSFVAQWALLLRETARTAGSRLGQVDPLWLVPFIAVAETFSWYSVLTTSNIGHVAEESIWGLCAALLVASVVALLPRTAVKRRPLLIGWCIAGLVYVGFMFAVDVPMYWARWIADETAGRHYLGIAQGVFDMSQRRIVSHRWEDWRHEVAWMSLYFSVAVWISISLVHAPVAKALPLERPKRFARSALGLNTVG